MDMPVTLTDRITEARETVARSLQLQEDAAHLQRQVARELKDAGWKGTDIAAAFELSQQRVSQLLAPTKQEQAQSLHDAGKSVEDIADLLKLSEERVSQLLANPS